jgi:hypothetical protein
MPLSDVPRAWQGDLASIVVGLGRDVAPLNHLGPHNPLEWVLYLGLFAVLLAVGVHVVRSGDDAFPPVGKPDHRKTSQTPGSDEWSDDRDT